MSTIGTLKYRIGTLKYRRYAAKSPQDPDAPAKWYARAVQDRTVEFEDFVTHISEHNSPYSRGVIHGVLIDMLACLKELVLDGKSVRLGDLGLFSVGISSKGAETAEAWTTSLITGVHLNVRNTKTWSNAEAQVRPPDRADRLHRRRYPRRRHYP